MKKVIVFLVFIFSSSFLFAQKEEWLQHFDKMKEVDPLEDDFYDNPDASKIPAIKNKYQEVLSLLEQVESKSSDYRDAVAYQKASILTSISFLYDKLKLYEEQEEYVNKAFSIWPYFSSISLYSVEKHLEFSNASPMDFEYMNMILLATVSAYKNKNYNRIYELEKLYEPVKKNIDPLYEWRIIYEIARNYETDAEKSEEQKAEHWVVSLEKWPSMSSENKEGNKGPFDYMVKKTNGMSTNDNSLQLRAAHALYAVEKYTEADKWYGNYAKSASSPTLDAGWDYSESAMKEPDKTDARNAVNIIEQHTSGFSEYEWERLQKVYEFIGDNARVQEIKSSMEEARRKAEEERRLQEQRDEEERRHREKADRKANARGNFSLAVCTNPFMYIWNDYPVSLDIRIGRIVNEFRVNFANTRDGKTDKFHFGQYKASGVAKNFGYSYSGKEYSYTLKIIVGSPDTKTVGRRKQLIGGYVGFQPRYSKYDFASGPYTFTDSITLVEQTFNNINASATRYEFTLLAGFIGDNLGGFFHIDYYFGVGVGYRKLDIAASLPDGTPDPAFTYDKYLFNDNVDRRFDPDRFSKLYVPVRFGFRIGINLL